MEENLENKKIRVRKNFFTNSSKFNCKSADLALLSKFENLDLIVSTHHDIDDENENFIKIEIDVSDIYDKMEAFKLLNKFREKINMKLSKKYTNTWSFGVNDNSKKVVFIRYGIDFINDTKLGIKSQKEAVSIAKKFIFIYNTMSKLIGYKETDEVTKVKAEEVEAAESIPGATSVVNS